MNVGVDAIKKYNVPLIYLSNDINGSIDGPISIKPYTYIKKPFNDNELKLAIEIALYREKIDNKTED